MAKILIRTVDGGNALRYMRGDAVIVRPDDHVWGRYESLEVWIAEGRDRAEWPDEFAVLELTGLNEVTARAYLEEISVIGAAVPEMFRRRKFGADIDALYALLPAAKKAIYANTRRITLSWGNAQVRAAFKAKA
jgi:hypothetical protein